MSEAQAPRTARLLQLAAPLIVFAAVTAALLLTSGSPSGTPEELLSGSPVVAAGSDSDEDPGNGPAAALDTEAQIAGLQRQLHGSPDSVAYARLGDAYYQRARETGDPAFYSRSERAYQASLARDPDDVEATLGLGTLALARHDFATGLELGLRAHRLEPGLVSPYTVIADAQIELGRYAEAAASVNRLVRLKPNLAAYARASYFRELQGDLDGAVEAMRLAVSAGGSIEGSAYVSALLGGLEFDRGRYAAADRAYREALAIDPGYPPALAGRARVDAASGRYEAAIDRYRLAVEALPLPEYAIALAEVEQAAGMQLAARRDYTLVEAQARLLEASGVNTGVERALFEADHGDPAVAVAAGRRAWRRAPSVRSADAYSWALHSAGRQAAAERLSRQAMKLGSRTPSFLYHAGMISRAAGLPARARSYLGALVRQSPRFHPLDGPRARRALEGLR